MHYITLIFNCPVLTIKMLWIIMYIVNIWEIRNEKNNIIRRSGYVGSCRLCSAHWQ
jgi:hypothetical protein